MYFLSLFISLILLHSPTTTSSQSLIAVIDASVDEYVACVLVTTMDEYHLDGIIIVNADCLAGPAMNSLWKVLSYLELENQIPIGLSSVKGQNSFPWSYRGDSALLGQIEIFNEIENNSSWPVYPSSSNDSLSFNILSGSYPDGDSLLVSLLKDAYDNDERITLLVHCPLTPIAECLQINPELESVIDRMIWMGGALGDQPGSLDPNTLPSVVANPKAEWNAFWDSTAVSWILANTSFPITMFPLNVTDQAKLTQAFKNTLYQQANTSTYSRLAYECYSVVKDEPFFEMWNVSTTCYLTRPELFQEPVTMQLDIITDGY